MTTPESLTAQLLRIDQAIDRVARDRERDNARLRQLGDRRRLIVAQMAAAQHTRGGDAA